MLNRSIIVSLLLALPQASFAGDIEAGKAKTATCVACHGSNGISASSLWPNLAGQQKDYLLKQMKDFKSGARKDPIMTALVQTLSEEDMKNISAYYNSLK